MFFVVQYNYKERINFLEKRKNVKSKTITEKHVQDMERIKNLRLIDDNFMTKVFEDKECVEILLKAIIKKNDLKVSSVNVQYDIKNLQGRSVRLDVLAEDVYKRQIKKRQLPIKLPGLHFRQHGRCFHALLIM